MKRVLCALLLLLGSLPAAVAAEVDFPVPIEQYEGIRFYSGGVGIEERRQLPQLYPLRLIFATDRGNLLCDTEVTLSAKGKAVFRGRAEHGPWLVVDLPAGSYDVEAVQDGKARSVKGVTVAAGAKRTVLLRWKTSEVDMGL